MPETQVMASVKTVDALGKIHLIERLIDNCLDCNYCQILPDADSNDWFCDDDQKAVCNVMDREITVSCRPYNLRKECKVPEWCPLKKIKNG